MKKIIFVLASICLILTGCGKGSSKDVLKNFKSGINSLKAYQIDGTLEIYRGEDSYQYDVSVSYQKDDNYRVSLINKVNNHEQIILRNDEGVYVLTPSLNKSFKFQSDWPYNNSQIYLLQIILSDIETDNDRIYEKIKDGHSFTTKVNYSTNKDLVKQKVYLDNDLVVTKIEVLNESDAVQMRMTFDKIDKKASFDDNYFSLESNLENAEVEETVSTIDEIIYPMYIPTNTYLTGQDRVETVSGERVILTFDGDNPFMLVEETVLVSDELDSNLIYGDPYLIHDTVGAITDYSVSWISNGVEYYLVSDQMNVLEMINVAESISVMPVGK